MNRLTLPAGREFLGVSRQTARRFLIRRSGLGRLPGGTARWPSLGDTVAAVRTLEYVQVDPMSVLAKNHDLVLGARVGGYTPEVLDRLLYRERSLVEVVGVERMIVPVEDYPIFAHHFRVIERRNRPKLAELEPVMKGALARIEGEGPLSSLDFTDGSLISGWWDGDGEAKTRAVRQALEWLWHFGRLAISRREGLRRYFDLPERVYGAAAAGAAGDGEVWPAEPGAGGLRRSTGAAEEDEELAAYRAGAAPKYFRAMGLSNPRAWHFGWSRRPVAERLALADTHVAAGVLVPVKIEGVETPYYVPSAEADDLVEAGSREPEPEVLFLPPLDNIVWDRQRLAQLWGFDYTWEAYVPPAKRRYGPYTCPILWGDIFVGRLDARVDRGKPERKEAEATPATLVVNGVWWEEGAARPPAAVFRAALEEWSRLNGAAGVADPTGALR